MFKDSQSFSINPNYLPSKLRYNRNVPEISMGQREDNLVLLDPNGFFRQVDLKAALTTFIVVESNGGEGWRVVFL
jgi:hypothetical protein